MPQRHVVEFALDLARMPALARTSVEPPIPPNITELLRIAAASPKACQDAVEATGESPQVLIDASRFCLQQLLFRPNADSYRILGLQPGASRATARSHMQWLLRWLHPDRNFELDAVYAARVVKAWREISSRSSSSGDRIPSKQRNGAGTSFRLPWIESPIPYRLRGRRGLWRIFLPVSLLIVFLALFSAVYYFGPEQTAAMIRMQ